MPTRNPLDWIALNLLPGLGPISIARALEHIGDPHELAFRVPVRQLAGLPGTNRTELARYASEIGLL